MFQLHRNKSTTHGSSLVPPCHVSCCSVAWRLPRYSLRDDNPRRGQKEEGEGRSGRIERQQRGRGDGQRRPSLHCRGPAAPRESERGKQGTGGWCWCCKKRAWQNHTLSTPSKLEREKHKKRRKHPATTQSWDFRQCLCFLPATLAAAVAVPAPFHLALH